MFKPTKCRKNKEACLYLQTDPAIRTVELLLYFIEETWDSFDIVILNDSEFNL